jgi:hypothetical protein
VFDDELADEVPVVDGEVVAVVPLVEVRGLAEWAVDSDATSRPTPAAANVAAAATAAVIRRTRDLARSLRAGRGDRVRSSIGDGAVMAEPFGSGGAGLGREEACSSAPPIGPVAPQPQLRAHW